MYGTMLVNRACIVRRIECLFTSHRRCTDGRPKNIQLSRSHGFRTTSLRMTNGCQSEIIKRHFLFFFPPPLPPPPPRVNIPVLSSLYWSFLTSLALAGLVVAPVKYCRSEVKESNEVSIRALIMNTIMTHDFISYPVAFTRTRNY